MLGRDRHSLRKLCLRYESGLYSRFGTTQVPETVEQAREEIALGGIHIGGPLDPECCLGTRERVDDETRRLYALLPALDGHVVARVAEGRGRQSVCRLVRRERFDELAHLVGNLLPPELRVAGGQ